MAKVSFPWQLYTLACQKASLPVLMWTQIKNSTSSFLPTRPPHSHSSPVSSTQNALLMTDDVTHLASSLVSHAGGPDPSNIDWKRGGAWVHMRQCENTRGTQHRRIGRHQKYWMVGESTVIFCAVFIQWSQFILNKLVPYISIHCIHIQDINRPKWNHYLSIQAMSISSPENKSEF